ncbi:SPOR domain-containing protein [Sphingomonas silueang]|uniref:SPOR domain-containing protein n=1 Tax=Sphingomonas silueang TaxID=3156617 RepID=UPI0032B44964
MTRFPSLRGTLLLLAATSPLPAVAQEGAIVQPLTPNADRLSEQMRVLGRSPNDLSALIEAGRLSGKLGDVDAAMQFLARAEKVSPGDPRIRAARAATLVGMERPGEALALFDQAERAGVAMAPYAAERGLAYDLLGHTANAQRDYRLALTQGPDDEITRRLALSLGIDGDVAGATALLNPLLRQNDRAAWRVRAFVLAMAGDAAGADQITASMLPGFSASLSPFFRRLPQLSAADRAFAVHFGRLAPTPERIADARFAPTVVPVPRAAPPVAVAAAAPVQQQPAARRAPTATERRAEARRQAEVARQAQLAEARRAADARAAQLAKAQADEAARRTALAQAEAQRLRDAQQAEAARLVEATRQEAVRVAARQAEERRIAAEALAARDAAAAAAQPAPPVQVAAAQPPVPVRIVERAPEPVASPTVAAAPEPVAIAAASPQPGFSAVPAGSNAAATVAARSAANDEVLARIIRNLDIPAAELGIAPPPAPAAAALPTAGEQAAEAQAARAAALKAEADARAAERAAAAKKAAEAKKLADAKKAAEAKKLADAKKVEAAAEAKKEALAKKADPVRHWVQVAGGANVADLPKAWKALAAKAPALKGRQAWTTPLRFTNRLLVGPFKTDDEAQDFVNTLRKAGLSTFAFTSEAGQKVTRVPIS